MTKRKIASTARLILFFALSLFPAFVIILGILLLIGDMVFNFSYAIAYVVIPVIAIYLIYRSVFSNKTKAVKIILTLMAFIGFIMAFMFSNFVGSFEMFTCEENEIAMDNYMNLKEKTDALPSAEDLGAYTELEHYEYYNAVLIFQSQADTFTFRYDSNEYQAQKSNIEKKYTFQSETINHRDHSCESYVEIEGYYFRMLDINGKYQKDVEFPKELLFIVLNDNENTVSYVYFEDQDRDYIDSLEDFILSNCGWRYILK